MKHLISTMVAFLLTGQLFSQLRYEELEAYSKTISSIQTTAVPLEYQSQKITFPEENFTVYFSNRLASYAYYAQNENGEDLLKVLENVDLSKAVSITYSPFSYSFFVPFVKVRFPANCLQVTTVQNGNVLGTDKSQRELLFFYRSWNWTDRAKLFKNLSDLILLLKQHKQLVSGENKERLTKAWETAVIENTKEGYKAFLKVYPQSIYTELALERTKYGLADALYSEEAKSMYDVVGDPTSSNLRLVKLNDKFGFIDQTTSKLVIPLIYATADPFDNGKARVSLDARTYFYIDKTGNKVE